MTEIIENNSENKISPKEKASFFMVNMGNIPIMTLIGAFLLIFYTDVVGLNPIAVAILFLVARILDGISDPIMGYLIDHLPETKWGKFRPYLVLGCLLCSLNYLLLWLGPSMAISGKLTVAFISYLLIGFTFDLMDIPLNSLIPIMTEDEKERNNLSIIKSVAYSAGGVAVTILTIPFISAFPDIRQGYHIWVIIIVIFVFVFTCLGTLGIQEKIQPISKEKYKFKDLIKIFSNKPVYILFITFLLFSIAGGATTAAGIYYWTYIIKQPELLGVMLLFVTIGGVVGFIIGTPLINHLGKKYLMGIGLLCSSIASFLISIINPSFLILLFSVSIITGFGGVLNQIVVYAMQADNMDYIEWKQGYRAEGAIASLSSFIFKAGGGIGASMAALILGFTGYVPNVEQTPQAITGIYLAFVIIPGILLLLSSLIIFFIYPITSEKMALITEELNKRREQNFDA